MSNDGASLSVLPDDCLDQILTHLDLSNQVNFAYTNPRFREIFKSYARRHYHHIDEQLTCTLSETQLEMFLKLVGEHVVGFLADMSQQGHRELLSLLSCYCPNLQKLKIKIRRGRWKDLLELTKLQQLHVHMKFINWQTHELFVISLQKLPHLKALHLGAANYRGREVCQLQHLETLEVGTFPGMHNDSLLACCGAMSKLRHLSVGHYFDQLETRDFEYIVKHCQQLEQFAFSVRDFETHVAYERICALPKLKKLLVWYNFSLRTEFLEALAETQLECLALEGQKLSLQQWKLICCTASLRELNVACDELPLAQLLKLQNLEYLHLSIPTITDDELLQLVQGCKRLHFLTLRRCQHITEAFVLRARNWMAENASKLRTLNVYAQNAKINWQNLREATLNENEHFVKISKSAYENVPVLYTRVIDGFGHKKQF